MSAFMVKRLPAGHVIYARKRTVKRADLRRLFLLGSAKADAAESVLGRADSWAPLI